jgi:hypothetical protein
LVRATRPPVLDTLGLRRPGRLGEVHGVTRLGRGFSGKVELGAQTAVVGGNGLLHLPGEVVAQMPAIRHLDRIRRASPGALGVGARTVAAQTTSVPGCSRSQAATVSASRSGST